MFVDGLCYVQHVSMLLLSRFYVQGCPEEWTKITGEGGNGKAAVSHAMIMDLTTF